MGKRADLPTCQPPVLIPIIVYVQYAEITDFTYVTGLFFFFRGAPIKVVHFRKNMI